MLITPLFEKKILLRFTNHSCCWLSIFFFSFVPLECFFDHCFLSGAVTDSISVLPHRYCFLTNNPKMPLKTFDMSAFAFLLFKPPVFGYFLKQLPHLFPEIIGFACD